MSERDDLYHARPKVERVAEAILKIAIMEQLTERLFEAIMGPEPGGMSQHVIRACHRREPGARRSYYFDVMIGRDRRGERVLDIRDRLRDLSPAPVELAAPLTREHRLRVSKWDWRILR